MSGHVFVLQSDGCISGTVVLQLSQECFEIKITLVSSEIISDDCVYKAYLLSKNKQDIEPYNLGTIEMIDGAAEFSACADKVALQRAGYDICDIDTVVIVLKNSYSGEQTLRASAFFDVPWMVDEKFCCDKNERFDKQEESQEVEDSKNYEEYDEYAPLKRGQEVLDDFKNIRKNDGECIGANKWYFKKLIEKLSEYSEFNGFDDDFKWWIINKFTTLINLSAIKYVLFNTLTVNAIDERGYYLFGIKKSSLSDLEKPIIIAVAVASNINPMTNIDDMCSIINCGENLNYYAAYIELAEDGQYFVTL